MATTTNYGWTTPDDTALVKDGASAIRTLGTSIDTTTKNLNPSTTLGDIEYRSSTANTNTRLGIGTSGQVLTVSGGVPAWSTPAPASSMTLISTTTLTGSSVVISSIPSTYKDLKLIIRDYLPTTDGQLMDMRVNADTGTRYNRQTYAVMDNSSAGFGLNRLPVCPSNDNAVANGLSITVFHDYANTDTYKLFENFAVGTNSTTTTDGQYQGGFLTYNQTAAISSITLLVTAGTFAGTALLYGVQ